MPRRCVAPRCALLLIHTAFSRQRHALLANMLCARMFLCSSPFSSHVDTPLQGKAVVAKMRSRQDPNRYDMLTADVDNHFLMGKVIQTNKQTKKILPRRKAGVIVVSCIVKECDPETQNTPKARSILGESILCSPVGKAPMRNYYLAESYMDDPKRCFVRSMFDAAAAIVVNVVGDGGVVRSTVSLCKLSPATTPHLLLNGRTVIGTVRGQIPQTS